MSSSNYLIIPYVPKNLHSYLLLDGLEHHDTTSVAATQPTCIPDGFSVNVKVLSIIKTHLVVPCQYAERRQELG